MEIDYTLTKEQEALIKKAHEFALRYKPFAEEWDDANRCPFIEIVDDARKAGLLGISMPKEYGGQGLTVLEYVLVQEELMRTSLYWGLGELLFSTSGPGPSVCARSEFEPVKKKYLRDIVTGRKRCAITMTEPKHGSNLDDLETTAEEKADHFVVNGSKRFITGAVDNDLYSTFVRFKNIPGSRGIGAIMIEKGTPGVTVLEGPAFVGCRGIPHGELFFENAKIPKENLEFREGKFGRLMEPFNMERMHNACFSLSLAEGAFDEAMKYAQTRKAFGKPISDFQAVYQDLAEMWTQIEAARALTYHAASTAIEGRYPRFMDVTIAKLFANQMAMKVTQMAMLLQGGDGTTVAFPAQRLWRDVAIAPVGGGVPPILRNMIAAQLLKKRLDQH